MSAGRTVLALDLGTRTGYCVASDSEPWVFGTHSFALGRYEGGGVRFLRFRSALAELAAGVDLVAFEEVGFVRHAQAAEVLHGFRTEVMTYCEGHGIPYQGVPVGTLKKFATGKGNANKDAMRAALRARAAEFSQLTLTTEVTHDEADALWVARYAMENIIPQRPASGSPTPDLFDDPRKKDFSS